MAPQPVGVQGRPGLSSIATRRLAGRAAALKVQLDGALLTPLRAMRWRYMPLLMVYFAAGALGLTTIAESFWLKNNTSLSAADLAALGVWLTLPWTIKMVFGELVDAVPILGSQRRAYVFIGAGIGAAGTLLLWSVAAGHVTALSPETAYKIASFLVVVGFVIQDVVADAMTTEVVDRHHPDGSPRETAQINRDLGMVQVLGRIAVTTGAFVVAGVGGWLASILPYSTVFLLGLVVPVISVTGAVLVTSATVEPRPIDWRILGGGIAFGIFAVTMALIDWSYAQEVVLLVSLVVVISMIARLTADLDADSRRVIFFASVIIFAFRAAPSIGEGYTWFSIDVLGFDEAFNGTLAQIGAALTLIVAWLFSDAITRQPVARVLLWLTIVTTVLELPGFGMTMGLHEWTERTLGITARQLAVIDAALTSPFAQLSLIPLFTLCAIYAPRGRAGTWFALMASLMSLAFTAGGLMTKYLNLWLVVERGQYASLPALFGIVLLIGLAIPVTAIACFGRKLR